MPDSQTTADHRDRAPAVFLPPEHPPVVYFAQVEFLLRNRLQRLVNLFSGGQFIRYLLVGGFNTLFGYTTFAVTLMLLSRAIPQRFLYLSAPLASILCTPLNITVAYLGYKFFVFRTTGNHLMEWLKCFAVYGSGMIPGLVALGALTRLLQRELHQHAVLLHAGLLKVEAHLHGPVLPLVQQVAHGRSLAGNLAGAVVMGVSTIYSFVGHKKVTFKAKRA